MRLILPRWKWLSAGFGGSRERDSAGAIMRQENMFDVVGGLRKCTFWGNINWKRRFFFLGGG